MHLRNISKQVPLNLWRYFAGDFFHDGCIYKIELHLEAAEVTMDLLCPNITRNTGNGREFVNVDFLCTFQGVVDFRIGFKDVGAVDYLRPQDFGYIRSELCGEVELLETLNAGRDEEFYSLVIETNPNEEYVYIIFSSVYIEAKEPCAYALMQANPLFEIPICKHSN